MKSNSNDGVVSQSELVDALRFPLAVMVVLSHCVIITQNVPASLSLSEGNVFLMMELFYRSFGPLSVAGFSLISGYYFFSKTSSWTLDGYKESVIKRVRSILIPYILWNLIAMAVVFMKNKIALAFGFAPGYSEKEMEMLTQGNFWDLMLLPFCGPLWYLRELFYLTLFSPAIYFLVRRLGHWSILLVAIPYLLREYWSSPVSPLIAFFFILGASLGMKRIEFLSLLKPYRWLAPITLVLYTIWVLFFNDNAYYLLVYNTLLVLMLGSIVYWVSVGLRNIVVLQTLKSLSSAVFFIYAVHFIVLINLVREGLYYLGLNDIPYGQTLVLIVTGVIVTTLSYLLYKIMYYVAPKSLAILCGGRIN